MIDTFPKTIYVESPLNPNEAYAGYQDYSELPEDTIVAVYELSRVMRVKETKSITLIEAPISTYKVVGDD